jgi:peptide/nickel transport system substrate-binding protein
MAKKLYSLIAPVLVLVLLLTMFGCQAQAPSPATSARPSATVPVATPSPSTQSAATTAAIAKSKYGGVLTFPLVLFPVSYDMHMRATFSPMVGLAVFNKLLMFDPAKPDITPQNIIGDLAQKWDVSADGLSYTFYLVKNATWHDGKPFTAADVVYSFTKIMDPKRSTISTYFKAFGGIEKLDDYTVRFKLTDPSPSFFTQLAGPYAAIQPAHMAGTDPKNSDFLVGTGPFKLKKVTAGSSIELAKNPAYFKKDSAGNQLPFLDGITMAIMTDRSAQVDAFVAKRLDMMTPGPGFSLQEQLLKIQQFATGSVVQMMKPPFNNNVLFINFKRKELQDVRVRQAIALVTDPRQGIIANYSDEGWGNYDYAIFSPPFGLPTTEINKLTQWDKPLADRAVTAKKLMVDAGYASGFKIKLLYTLNYQKRIVWLADVLKRYLNIDADITSYDDATAFTMRANGDFDIGGFDTQSFIGDPDEIMGFYRSGSPSNYGKYSNPDIDKLWDEQTKTLDLAKRIQLTQQIERNMLTDWPVIPFPYTNYGNAWWPYVKGFTLQNGSYMSYMAFEYTWLDK